MFMTNCSTTKSVEKITKTAETKTKIREHVVVISESLENDFNFVLLSLKRFRSNYFRKVGEIL